MATWLNQLMIQFEIDKDKYSDIYNCLISETLDTAEKVELLDEKLSDMDPQKSELFVRQVLELLESKTVDSLLNPSKYDQEVKKSTKKTKPVEGKYSKPKITNPNPSTSRIDADAEKAVLTHLSNLKVEEENDPFENEIDVYNTLSPAVLVQMLFSNMSPEQVEKVLEQHHYNLDDTMESLFNLEDSSEGNKKQSKQVCRHFLLGQCYRSDCWYSHDPDVVLCKFWLKGRCYKGDQCEFSHGESIDQFSIPIPGQSSDTAVQEPPKMDEFPALGGGKSVSKKPVIDFWAPTAQFSDTARKQAPVRNAREEAQIRQLQKGKILADADWVTTGDTLSNSYLKYRTDAIEAALNRNRLFQKATDAYLAGNKAAARQLSLAAHELNNQVSTLHSQAAKNIFKQRNSNLDGSRGDAVIDLHGLHPNEAVDILSDTLNSLVSKSYRGKVIIVTGTGHHSRGRVKVLPAVRQYLEQRGWKPKDASLADGKGGMLIIQI